MVNAQRAVHSVAVPGLRSTACVPSMAPVAHVVRPKAVEHGNVAAEHALPVDLLLSVLFADVFAAANLFQDAVAAQ